MTDTLHVFAPAKINLFLHILGQNPNGYHRVQTLFQLLNFGDTLTFERLADSTITCIAPGCSCPVEENLAYRAAQLLQEHYRCTQGVRIHIDKQIPSGAGLGGGSSDAGATLRALNVLWQLNASLDALLTLGSQLGADVPVFVLNRNAWAEGIGDELTAFDLPAAQYILLDPRCAVPTVNIYQHADLPRDTVALSKSDYTFATTHNDCETLVCKLYPEIAKARAWLSQFGTPRLTGTGACLFLAVPSEEAAEEIKKQAPKGWRLIYCQGL